MNLLTETYRPKLIADFIGLEKPKQKMAMLASKPFASAWLFVGPSGLGKTTLALALAAELNAELHHIPSQKCTVEAVAELRNKCKHVPMFGSGWRVILVDEADSMSKGAEDAFLSLLDSTNRPENTIIIFTCNESDSLAVRFQSRCFVVKFSSQGIAEDTASMLARVWDAETNGNVADAPNFRRIVKDANNNIRTALMELHQEIMMLG